MRYSSTRGKGTVALVEKTRVSICMITAQGDRPLLHRSESVYDVFRSSVSNQTYDGPIEVIVADAWVDRLHRPGRLTGWGRADRVVFTRQALHDRIAISAARNTAAAYARGELLIFLDDCVELLPSFVAAAVDVHKSGKIPTRVAIRVGHVVDVDPTWREQGCPMDRRTWALSGQAGSVFVISREMFCALNGFDENFDGNWGCEDQEFWARVDRARLPRVGRPDLAVLCWAHVPTPPRGRIRRCRELYAQWAYRSSRADANRRLSDEVLEQLRRAPPCSPTCDLCRAPDRAGQIETYRTIPADFDLRALHATYSVRPGGVYLDPWR